MTGFSLKRGLRFCINIQNEGAKMTGLFLILCLLIFLTGLTLAISIWTEKHRYIYLAILLILSILLIIHVFM
jgi:hypothetical protein